MPGIGDSDFIVFMKTKFAAAEMLDLCMYELRQCRGMDMMDFGLPFCVRRHASSRKVY